MREGCQLRPPDQLLRAGGCCLVLALSLHTDARAEQRCVHAELRVSKRDGQLRLLCAGRERWRATVSFGGEPRGPKHRSGDERTPEGRYFVCTKHASAKFYRFLGISYPNLADARAAQARGQIGAKEVAAVGQALARGRCPPWNTALGAAVGIHGLNDATEHWALQLWHAVASLTGLQRYVGFSNGCIMASNGTVDLLWDAVAVGTPVIITPIDQEAQRSARRNGPSPHVFGGKSAPK